jgi:hypothetical protein
MTGQQITIAVARANLGPGDATNILDGWAVELEDFAKSLGYSVIDISGPNLTYEGMTRILTATKPKVLFNFSHGCGNYLMGNDMQCTLTNGFPDNVCGSCNKLSNLSVLKNTALIAYSCNSGAQLGKCVIRYGSPAYVGFSDSLIVVSDKYGMQNIFKDALMPMAYNLLKGIPAGAAVAIMKAELEDTVKKFKPVELLSVPLWYNRKYLTQFGDPNWSIFL